MTATRTVTPDGTALATERLAGPGPLVAILHGFTGDRDTMRPLADGLGPAHEVLLVDLVGHGRSDAPTGLEPYRMTSVVDQVLSLLSDRSPGSTHVLGYSMGGRVALSMARRAPWFFASVITLSATAGIEDPTERAERHREDLARADRLDTIGVEAFVDEWLDQDLFAPLRSRLGPDGVERAKANRAKADGHGLAQSLRGTGTGAMEPVWDAVPGFRCPLLALAGALDPPYVERARRLATTAADGHCVVLEECGHALPLEAPEATARHVLRYLEHWADSP